MSRRVTALRHLLHLLRGRWFRRLFAVRCAASSPTACSRSRWRRTWSSPRSGQPAPAAIAAALAVVLLPFSVLGPFVGVFLDRWSRRQVLAWSNFVRVALVGLLALAVHVDLRGPALFGLILLALSVNRFLLAALSASLPHVVATRGPDHRQRAHADGRHAGLPGRARARHRRPAGLGGRRRGRRRRRARDRGRAVRRGRGRWPCGSPATCSDPTSARPGRRPRGASGTSRAGWSTGCGTSAAPRRRRTALAAIGAHRFCYGISTVVADPAVPQLLPRPRRRRRGLRRAVGRGAGQRGRLRRRRRADPGGHRAGRPRAPGCSGLLVGAAVTQVFPGALYTQPGAAGRGVLPRPGLPGRQDLRRHPRADARRRRVPRPGLRAVRRDLQRRLRRRGRRLGALVLPEDGKSYVVLAAVSGGYLLTAVLYARATRAVVDPVTGPAQGAPHR